MDYKPLYGSRTGHRGCKAKSGFPRSADVPKDFNCNRNVEVRFVVNRFFITGDSIKKTHAQDNLRCVSLDGGHDHISVYFEIRRVCFSREVAGARLKHVPVLGGYSPVNPLMRCETGKNQREQDTRYILELTH